MATAKKMVKKAQEGMSIVDKLAAKTAERNTKGAPLREGQKKRMTRIFEANPDRGIKVAKRMQKRADASAPAMKTGGLVPKKNSVSKNISNLNKAKAGAKMKKKAC